MAVCVVCVGRLPFQWFACVRDRMGQTGQLGVIMLPVRFDLYYTLVHYTLLLHFTFIFLKGPHFIFLG